MKQLQIENSFLETKVEIRNKVSTAGMNILDCYSADGLLWEKVKEHKQLNVLRIEKEKGKKGIYLRGDNVKFMQNMDLSGFDIIDLDAFGNPVKPLEVIFRKNLRNKIIIFTFIVTVFKALDKTILIKLGYTDAMMSKVKTIFVNEPFEKFKNYLSKYGIKKIYYWTNESNKFYGYFHI